MTMDRAGRIKLAREIGAGLTLIVMAVAVGIILVLAGIFFYMAVANSDLRARARTTSTITSEADNEVSTSLVLHRLVPTENAAEASLTLVIEQGATLDSIRDGSLNLTARVNADDLGRKGTAIGLASVSTLHGKWPHSSQIEVISDRFMLPLYSSVVEFPRDHYLGFLSMSVERVPSGQYPSTFLLVKEFPGWVVATESSPLALDIIIRRPGVEQFIVALSVGLYLIVAGLVIFAVFKTPSDMRGLSGATAFAGFVLAGVGFREMIGLSNLPSRSWMDLVLVVLPLAALLVVLCVSHKGGSRKASKAAAQ